MNNTNKYILEIIIFNYKDIFLIFFFINCINYL